MLKTFKVRNFYSVGDWQKMSFEINKKDILNDSSIEIDNKYFNLVSCVIGANGSGKTNILKAINFLFWFIQNSYTEIKNKDNLNFNPHRLKENETTAFEIEFLNNGVLYKYYLELNDSRILKERLYKKIKRYTPVFELERNEKETTIKTNKLQLNDGDKKRFKERENVSLLSSLINTAYLSEINFFENFKSNVGSLGIIRTKVAFIDFPEKIYQNDKLQNKIQDFIDNIGFQISEFNFLELGNEKKFLFCLHKNKEKKFNLPFAYESNGTQETVNTLSEFYPILEKGGLVVIDEIETGMHPYILQKIISLFENKETNPNNAQLIFSTHQHLLLNDRTKTQIFITEKNKENFETEIYRLDEIEGIRNDDNYFHKYMAGVYGGTPEIGAGI